MADNQTELSPWEGVFICYVLIILVVLVAASYDFNFEDRIKQLEVKCSANPPN